MNQTGHGKREWREAEHVCALVDVEDERHLGHVLKTEQWQAYDATHFDAVSCSMTYLGAFDSLEESKLAVEAAVARKRGIRAMGAGAASPARLM